MNNSNLHGGDLDEISRIYGIEKESIINFSGNVNPLGLPPSVKSAIADNIDACTNYPDTAYMKLRKAISDYTGADLEFITVGNGSTELISGYIKYVCPKKAVLISPAYSEYLKEIKAVGGKAHLFELKEEDSFRINTENLISSISKDTDLLVICNPNNPTGSYITEDNLKIILDWCAENAVKVMIDETYVEFSEKDKKVSAIGLVSKYSNLFVVRGTSKFFACPGIRLGYGICSDSKTIEFINSNKDLWSVNVFAEIAGQAMFTDKGFIDATLKLIKNERERFVYELGNLKELKLYDTQSNFFLAKITREDIDADYIFSKLIKEGILIRNCKDFPFINEKFIRFCILDKKQNIRLIESLKNILFKGVI